MSVTEVASIQVAESRRYICGINAAVKLTTYKNVNRWFLLLMDETIIWKKNPGIQLLRVICNKFCSLGLNGQNLKGSRLKQRGRPAFP